MMTEIKPDTIVVNRMSITGEPGIRFNCDRIDGKVASPWMTISFKCGGVIHDIVVDLSPTSVMAMRVFVEDAYQLDE